MRHFLTIFIIFSSIIILTSCTGSTKILKDKNFSTGDWLLVKNNDSIYVIDDKNILENNPNGIKVNYSESDHYTTCDGLFRLYKNGKLILEQLYLEPSRVKESNAIKTAYKKAIIETIEPKNDKDLKYKMDSLRKIPKCYPTIFHAQPEDKDFIGVYKYK